MSKLSKVSLLEKERERQTDRGREGEREVYKARIGCQDEGVMTCVSRIGIKFIDPMNRTYGVELPKYQSTENPKYQKSEVPNTLMRPYIFVTRC
jgi:hypothetical protein